MRRILPRAEAEAMRAELNAKRGYPRVHPEHELVRVGGGIHVKTVETTNAVAIEGGADEVTVTIDDDDEQHVEPTRRARLREAREPDEIRPPHRDEK